MAWFFTILLLAVAAGAGWLFLRSYLTGVPIAAALFPPKPEKRLMVMEQTSVDNRRRLILIKRDNVEHLIMTGGPVDLVVESGIGAPTSAAPARARIAQDAETSNSAPVFGRHPRVIGQAAGE